MADSVFPNLVGDEAVVVDRLDPRGRVRLHDELWTAVTEESRPIEVGQRVRILRMDGTILSVEATPTEDA